MKLNTFLKKNQVLFLGLLIMLLKLFIVDVDPPVWKETLYQPVDEPYYVYPAYNYFETGDLFVADDGVVFGNSILLNAVTYISLEVFGDNYLGLRFSSIFFGVISLILFFLLLKKITKSLGLHYAAVIFFVLNFSFTTANLILEPTMVRMVTAILSLWLVVRWKEKQSEPGKELIWQATLISFLFIISYPTNAFLVLAAYIALVVTKPHRQQENGNWFNLKKILRCSMYFGIGCLISLFIYFLINLYLEVDIISDIFGRASKYEERTGFGFRELFVNFFKLVLANSFRFNPLWLITTVITICGIFLGKWKKLDLTVYATLLFLGSFVLQSGFINDYPWRKLIILLPFLLLLVIHGSQTLWERWGDHKKLVLFWFFGLSIVFFLVLLYWEQSFFSTHIFPLFTTALGIFLIVFTVVNKTKRKFVPIILFMLLMLPEIYYSTKHYLINRTYHYKDMYESLSEYDGHYFIGGSSMGFRVYNKTKPLLSKYLFYNGMDEYWEKTDSLARNGLKDYSIDYDYQAEEYKKIGFRPVKILMPAEETVWDTDIILYEEITPH